MTSLFAELRRRHVYRVAVVYIVMSWLVLQVGDIVLGTFDTPDWVMKALLALLVIGFPLAVSLAWAFEITPEGVRRTEPADSPEARAPEDRRHVGRKLNLALGAALAAALGFIGWQHLSRPAVDAGAATTATQGDEATTDSRQSIAVLPLANGSGDPEQEYFSDGLTEELIAGLGRIDELKVIGRSSSFQFKGTNTPGTEVGEKLGVAHLLEGSVRQQADRVRIVVSLVRAVDGSTLWTQTYDRQLDDIFAVQSEIAQAVATALQVRLGTRIDYERPPNGNFAAYQAMLRGHAQRMLGTTDGRENATGFYREAIRLEPDYAAAHAYLALALLNLATTHSGTEKAKILQTEARAASDRAMVLAPEYHTSLRVRGHIAQTLDGDLEAAGTAYRRAHALAPNDGANSHALARHLTQLSQWDEAIALMEEAVVLEPLNVEWWLLLAALRANGGDNDGALEASQHAATIAPNHPGALSRLSRALRMVGRSDEAVDAARRGIAANPDNIQLHLDLANSLEAGSRIEASWAAFEAAQAMAPNHADVQLEYGLMLLYYGRATEAEAHLRRAIEADPHGLRAHVALGSALSSLGRLDDAEKVLREAVGKNPAFNQLHAQLTEVAALRGDLAAARAAAEAEADRDQRRYALGLVRALEGDAAGFEAAIRRLVDDCQTRADYCQEGAAMLYGFARQPDRLFAMLDAAARNPGYRPSLGHPFLAPYLHDPRFIAHLDKFGMSLPSPVSQPASSR